jgi:hypothetical protein
LESDALEELLSENLRGAIGGGTWARNEIVAIVRDYLFMLDDELSGRPYSKTAHRDALRMIIPARSDGSIERKHQNISAVLQDLGLPWIEGYKPLSNYQQMLRDVVEAAITLRGLDSLRVHATEIDVSSVFVEPPTPLEAKAKLGSSKRKRSGRKTDHAAMDAKNRTLGEAGESFVVDLERARLNAAGRSDLADRVAWTAKDVGDGMGYDVGSFDLDEKQIYIEVKTTCGAIDTPFFVTKAEVDASAEFGGAYRLYRVFDFAGEKHVYQLRGSLKTCVPRLNLLPISYRASFHNESEADDIEADSVSVELASAS